MKQTWLSERNARILRSTMIRVFERVPHKSCARRLTNSDSIYHERRSKHSNRRALRETTPRHRSMSTFPESASGNLAAEPRGARTDFGAIERTL